MQGGRWVVRDLESANGTYVNDERVEHPHVLNPNDVLSAYAQHDKDGTANPYMDPLASGSLDFPGDFLFIANVETNRQGNFSHTIPIREEALEVDEGTDVPAQTAEAAPTEHTEAPAAPFP